MSENDTADENNTPEATRDDVIGAGTPGSADGPVKDPENWVTGDQPMTDAQRSYLDSLAKRAGEQLPADLTKAQASEHIDRLQDATGVNQDSNAQSSNAQGGGAQ